MGNSTGSPDGLTLTRAVVTAAAAGVASARGRNLIVVGVQVFVPFLVVVHIVHIVLHGAVLLWRFDVITVVTVAQKLSVTVE